MTNPNVEETRPTTLVQPQPAETNRSRRWPWVLLGIAIVLVGLAAGSLFGYQSGVNLRVRAEAEQRTSVLTEQYKHALEDQLAGRINTAIDRVNYVLSIDPGFPGAKDLLAELLIAQQLTSTPATPTPTVEPTFTPTPDVRGEAEMFDQARGFLASEQWNDAIQTLTSLRNLNVDYRSVDVDGMYYVALRYRGVDKILIQGSLESGIYDLTLAEKIGPLDVDAKNYRTWARNYLTAASYWDKDWPRVIAMFADLYPALPALRDASGMTTTERYRIALIKWGDIQAKQEAWCEAQTQYEQALMMAPDETVQPKFDQAKTECEAANAPPPAEEQPSPTIDPLAPTPTLDPSIPTATPDPSVITPTIDPNAQPTEALPTP